MASKRYKKLSPVEWIYFSLCPHFPPFAVQLLIEGETLPSLQKLEQALFIAAEANPGAKLVRDGRWWIDSGKAPRIRQVSGEEKPSLSHPLFHEPFLFGENPPIEILYWHETGLVFRCSHLLMDAGGLLFFAEETFRALREEPLLGSNISSFKRKDFQQLMPAVRRGLPRADKISPVGIPIRAHSGFLWGRRTIPGQVSGGASKIAYALAQLVWRRQENATIKLMLPMDIRKIDGGLRSTANLSNPIFLEMLAGSRPADFYGCILQALASPEAFSISRLESLLPGIPAPLLGRLQRWLHIRQERTDRYPLTGLISYIGPVSLASLSAGNFSARSAFSLPFDTPSTAITIIALQHENALEVVASCPASTGSDGQLEKVLDRIEEELARGKHAFPVSYSGESLYKPLAGTDLDVPGNLTVHALLSRQFKEYSDRVAVTAGERSCSYAEVENLSLKCALQLKKQGVRAGDKVALFAGRTVETIAALLGILRLGAAFVPVDPEWPIERTRFVLNDCQPACVLLDRQDNALIHCFSCLLIAEIEKTLLDDFESCAGMIQDSPAYVLYTSGSTGQPKGVVVGQRSLLNYLLWAKDVYLEDLSGPAVFPFFTSLAFDLTLTSIFLPLATGGEIRIFPHSDPLSAIRAILCDPLVNAVKLTPSHLWIFSTMGIANSGLRKFIVGGEALPAKLAREISLQMSGMTEIFNEYGPTEATIGCVMHRYLPGRDVDAFVPIGKPIANTEVLMLDENLQPVKEGEAAEIYLAGECLARGYLNRIEEEDRFCPHPFRRGSRVYRTGDRAVIMSNGELDYRGRIDEQVKVLGHRIEISEIERAIEGSECCDEYAVVAAQTPGATRLIAFVNWREGKGRDNLYSSLARILPHYMIPSRIVELSRMPLTINGKVDKVMLSKLVVPLPDEIIEIADSMEAALLSMIAGLPGSPGISVSADDSLHEVGLNSLQVMLLFTHAAKQFLPPSSQNLLFHKLDDFYHAPTIRNLARHIRALPGFNVP